ncbi:uncharacterized protein LOC110755794 [Prunus avium]|uniref:Uncharacterized protein LOC110755794 n=1 Tax=Prunus avium TaxID=42229 RepID=A0A6P5SGS4_PRUAV|nr:uncharacterized protein LOC110755794 [Prunus avium]
MISGGAPLAETSNRSVKNYVRAVRHPQILSIAGGRNDKIRRLGREPITFSEEEEGGIIFPHSDPMIIRADVSEFDVGRILIDTGSSVNVLFADAFNALGIDPQHLNKDITPLLSFSGDVVKPIGSVQLPFAVGTIPRRTIIYTHFLVVDCPTAYNAIIGRTTLTKMKAMLSPHMLLLKFPTHAGVGQVRGDQLSARTCYVSATKDSARATLHEAYYVATNVVVPNGRGADKPDDPRDEAVTPQAQPIEDLESVTLSEAQPDRQVRIGTTLSSALLADFIAFLRANTEVFAWSYNDMPGIAPSVISHKLSICPTFKPIRQKWRAYDAERYEAMRLEVQKMKTIGFIQEVTYPIWLANSVLVKESSGAWRMCQDYTDLNNSCPKDSFPLPRIDQMVDATAGHELLSFMDAYSGYNQIFMSPTDREHTAFITDKGLYCYNAMPFGLKNTRATYQRLVNKIFSELIGTTMEVYVDDMLVKRKTADSHLHNLSLMFSVLKQYNMRLNPSKCAFGVSSGKFLGFMISQRGIEANPEKSRHCSTCRYRRRRKIFRVSLGASPLWPDRCAPFFKALKGSKRQIVWTTECDRAFQDLKAYMSRAPLLSTPLPGEELILYLSVSATALSSVLIRKPNGIELPIFYISHALQDAELRYPELEKLAYALVLSARKLRPYFQAHSITVLTNQPLRQILQRPETSGRLVKWAIELSEFDIHYHPRPAEKGQAVADFISEMTTSESADSKYITPGLASGSVAHPTEGTFNPSIPLWTLYVDGSSNRQGSGAGLVLKAPDQTTIEYAIRFQFQASNNEAEYKALLAGLRLAKEMGAQQQKICSDSQLVVNQVLTEFEAKDTSMAAYLTHARRLLHHFTTYQVQ